MNHHVAARTTGICSIAAGLLHCTVVAYQHWTPFPPLEAGFFIAGGLLQLFLGIQFLRTPTLSTYRSSLVMNGGMAAMYFIVRFLPVPFVGEPESHETLGLIVVALELIVVGSSLRWLLTHVEHGQSRTFPLSFAAALLVTILGGIGYYGSAQSMAMLMPDRKVAHHHGHGKAHPHHPKMKEHHIDEPQNNDDHYKDENHHDDDDHHEEE